MFSNPKAVEVMKTDWQRFWDKNVWGHDRVREWAEVARDAQGEGETIHFGRVFGIFVQKGPNCPMMTHARSSSTG